MAKIDPFLSAWLAKKAVGPLTEEEQAMLAAQGAPAVQPTGMPTQTQPTFPDPREARRNTPITPIITTETNKVAAPKGAGDNFNKETEKRETKRNESTQRPAMVGVAQEQEVKRSLADLYQQDAENSLSSFKDQQQGIRAMEDQLRQIRAMPRQLDLSPLAALVDAQTGSNFAKSYKNPSDTAFERQEAIAKLQGAIQTARGSISKNDLGYIKAALLPGLKDTATVTSTTTSGGEHGYKPPTGRGTKVDDFTKDLTAHEKRIGPDFAALVSSFQALDSSIGGIDNYKGDDIPGAGATGMLARYLPGMVSGKGANNAKHIQNIENRITYLESGKQINENEAARLRTALGTGKFATDEDLVQGLSNFREELGQIAKSKEIPIRHRPGAWAAWKAQGGLDSNDIFNIGKGKSADKAPKAPPASGPKKPAFQKKSNDELMKLSPTDFDAYEKAYKASLGVK